MIGDISWSTSTPSDAVKCCLTFYSCSHIFCAIVTFKKLLLKGMSSSKSLADTQRLQNRSHCLMCTNWKWLKWCFMCTSDWLNSLSLSFTNAALFFSCSASLSVLNFVLSACHKSRQITRGDFVFLPLMVHSLSLFLAELPASAHAEREGSLHRFICQSKMVEGTMQSIRLSGERQQWAFHWAKEVREMTTETTYRFAKRECFGKTAKAAFYCGNCDKMYI